MAEDAKSRQPENESGNEKEVKKDEKAAEKTVSQKDYDTLTELYKKANDETLEWKNKYYLAYADTQNLRKDLEKDHQTALKYRAEGFLDNLLPALDSFYIALQATPKDPESKAYQQGFQYLYNQIENALFQEGVSEILPKVGENFDSAFMHAVDTKEGAEDGKIVQIFAKGYKLHDRLIRPAMVSVSKKKVETTTDEKQDSKAHKA
jgi:molecular chaperone GrpE